jgi:hypothetical protein
MPKVKSNTPSKQKKVARRSPGRRQQPYTLSNTLANVGSSLGRAAGAMFTRVTGLGDYQVASNSLLTNNGAPMFSPSKEGMIVRHREYIRDVMGASSFTNTSTLLNPANATLFPWLSNLAKNFETFQWKGLLFFYNPTSGAISSTQSLGTVILSTNYDVLNAAFASKAEAEAYQFTTSCVPSREMTHPIECKPSAVVSPRMYITDLTNLSDLPTHADPRLYFTGLMQQMVVGCPSTEALGELWVSYEVEFFTPKKPQALSVTGLSDSFVYNQETELYNPSASFAPGSFLTYANAGGPDNVVTVAAVQGATQWFRTPTLNSSLTGADKRAFYLLRDGTYTIRFGEQWAGGGVSTATNGTAFDWTITAHGSGCTIDVLADGADSGGLFTSGSNINATDTLSIYDIYRASGHISIVVHGTDDAADKYVEIGCPYVAVASATLSTSAHTVGKIFFRCTELLGTSNPPVPVYPPTSVSSRPVVRTAPQRPPQIQIISREAQRGLVSQLLDIVREVDSDAFVEVDTDDDPEVRFGANRVSDPKSSLTVSCSNPRSLEGILHNLRAVRLRNEGCTDQKSLELTAALNLFERQIKAAYGDDGKKS